MKWIKNIENIAENGYPGNCPCCDNTNTDYTVEICNKETQMGYGIVWCNNCKHAFHISRIKIDKNINKQVPSNLIFD